MQKKIIALAIAAAFSAPAFADTTVYGVLDAGYANAQKTLTTPAGVATKTGESSIAYSTMTSSRLGFKNTEDLDGGMKMTTVIETGIGSNQMAGFLQSTGVTHNTTAAFGTNGTTIDATSIGSRELWMALAFGQGTTVKAGYGSTLVRDISLGYDAAPGGNLVGNVLNNDGTLSSNRVVGVTVAQDFGAIKGTVQISHNSNTADGKTDVQKNNGYLFGLQYNQGPISAGFAYQSLKNTAIAATAPFGATTDVTTKVTILAGSYDLEVAKIFAEYANVKNDDAGVNALSVGTGKRTYESIGVDVPFTSAAMGFVQLSHGSVNEVTTASVASNSRTISGYTVGAKYNLSKASYGYASVGENKLDSAAGAADTGVKVDQFALGLVHTF